MEFFLLNLFASLLLSKQLEGLSGLLNEEQHCSALNFSGLDCTSFTLVAHTSDMVVADLIGEVLSNMVCALGNPVVEPYFACNRTLHSGTQLDLEVWWFCLFEMVPLNAQAMLLRSPSYFSTVSLSVFPALD